MNFSRLLSKNIGRQDRLQRLVIGGVLLVIALLTNSLLIALAGVFVLFEAAASWCVFNAFLGKNTCEMKQNK